MEVTLVHLSDLHFKNDTENRYRIEKLREDISSLPTGSRTVTAFTGDLVQSGGNEQYEVLFELLLGPLIEAQHEIVIVPGNHDVDRALVNHDLAEAYLNDKASSYLFDGTAIKSWPDKNSDFNPLQNYTELESLFEPYAARSFYGYYKQLGDLSVVGMNSTWLSHEWPNGISDRGRLRVEPYILQQYTDLLPENSLKVLLLHHPFDWLEENTRDAVTSLATKHFDLVLFGHVHTADVSTLVRSEGGASLIQSPPLRADWSKGTNGYSLIRCETESKAIEISYRSYSKSRRQFVVGEDFGSGGIFYPTENDRNYYRNAPSRSSLAQRFQERAPHDYSDWHRRNIGAKSRYIEDFIVPHIGKVIFDGQEQLVGPKILLSKLSETTSKDQFVIAPGDSGLSTSAFLALKDMSERVTETGVIPVFFDAEKNKINKASILRSMVQTCLVQYTTSEMEHLAQIGSLKLIVDGLNLSNADQFNLFRDTIGTYFPKVRVLAFVRTEKLGQSVSSDKSPSLSVSDDEIFELAELGVEQIREIICIQGKTLESETAEKLAVNAVDCLVQMNEPIFPSTVAVLVETLVQDHDFRPINKVRLLDRYVECLLGRFDLEDVREGTFSSHDKIELLSYLARILLESDRPGLSEQECNEALSKYENEFLIELPNNIVNEFEEKGLLVSDSGQITFRADYLFSYFVARQMKSDSSFAEKIITNEGMYRHHSEIVYYGELEGTDTGAVLDQLHDLVNSLEEKLLEQYSREGIDLREEWNATVEENPQEAIAALEEVQAISETEPDPKVADASDNSKLGHMLRSRGIARRHDVTETEARLYRSMRLYAQLIRNAMHIDGQSKLRHVTQLYEAAETWVGFVCSCRTEIGFSPVTLAGGIRFINPQALFDKVKSVSEFKYNAPNSISRILAEAFRNPQMSIVLRNVLPKLSPMGCLFAQEALLNLPSEENRRWYIKSLEKSDNPVLQKAALRTLKRQYLGSGRNKVIREHTAEIVGGIRKKLGEQVLGNPNTLEKRRLVNELKEKASKKKN